MAIFKQDIFNFFMIYHLYNRYMSDISYKSMIYHSQSVAHFVTAEHSFRGQSM